MPGCRARSSPGGPVVALSRAAMSAGLSSFTRTAASLIASGRPSTRTQTSATAAALSAVTAKSGWTARASAANICTDGVADSRETSIGCTACADAGIASGGTEDDLLEAEPQVLAAGDEDADLGAPARGCRRSRRPDPTTCSALSSSSRTCLPWSQSCTTRRGPRSRRQLAADPTGQLAQGGDGIARRGEIDEHHPVGVLAAEPLRLPPSPAGSCPRQAARSGSAAGSSGSGLAARPRLRRLGPRTRRAGGVPRRPRCITVVLTGLRRAGRFAPEPSRWQVVGTLA